MKTLVKINPNKNFFLPLVGCISNAQKEIVILDPTVPDSNHIASGIKPGTATYILESQPDAIEQITTVLAQHTSIEALHIITHGSPGSLYLGTKELNSSNIENYSQQLQQWRNNFSANASIILYGCNVAAGETGHQFLTQLHQLTGANIAANSHPTGNSALGGTWDIPQLIPPSPQRFKLAVTETIFKTYSGVLGFATKVDFATGSGPFGLSIGDFNGDGKPDLAVANATSNTASILLNTTPIGAATPTFAPQVTFPTGSGPLSVSIGDINADGKPDLAVANRTSNSASILLNTTPTNATTPTFASQVTFATGTNPYSVSIGDFNGDGKPDLAVANRTSNSASILLNTTPTNATTPTFASQVTFATGNNPWSLSIGDFNGDGKPDLAVPNENSNNVSIRLNTTATGATTPTFASQVTFATGNDPRSVSIGDFNGDGKPDLAVANFNSSSASILLNTTATGATTPTFASEVRIPTDDGPFSVSIGDFNGDGKPDLSTTNTTDTASILLNTTATGATTPTFASQVTFATGTTPVAVSIGDINGDGKPDLATANFESNPGSASILLNTSLKVNAVTATTADGSYSIGSTINITVTFDAAVNVTGTPQLQLETGTTDQFATYISGSGSTALTFNYVVQAGDTSADLEYLSINALTLNGGTIKETAGTAFDAFLTLPTLASANSLSGSKALVIDGVAPSITSVTSTTANGSYGTTSNINVTVNFSEAVTLAGGNMTVALDTGGTVTIAPFTGTSAVGSYIPAAGQNSTDLNSTGVTLAVGATLRDAVGNNATLTIPAGQSLANSKAIVVDTVVPTVALTSASPTTTNAPFLVTATFSESVTGFIASDVNLTNSTISNFTGSGTTYNFTVTPNASGAVTVDVPAATATDIAGNNNTAATQLTRTADITAPTVALTSASPTTTNAPFLVTATFSESVTGFIATGVNVTNGTVSNFAGSGTTYNFTVTPNADGNVTVDVPAAIATGK
ncbi:FG-GAP-like repeat-containing protein [Microcoleus vaginatus GB2-A3]|uniref:FG-GAP-like repeat-containing protein n=1 Tax=Microcoleus vaginatus TaxID=119532 RepID=UPI0032A53412